MNSINTATVVLGHFKLVLNGSRLADELQQGGMWSPQCAADAMGIPLKHFEYVMNGGAISAHFMAAAVRTVPATLCDLFEISEEPVEVKYDLSVSS